MVPDPRWFQCGSRSFFYLKADSDPDQPSQKVAFFNILSIHQKDSKIKTSLFWKTGNIGQFPCSWIRTHIPNKDSDPWEPSQSGSGSTTLVTCTKIGSKRPVFKILFLTNSTDPDQRQWLQAVLRICDIKDRYLRSRMRIRILGSIPLTNGSASVLPHETRSVLTYKAGSGSGK